MDHRGGEGKDGDLEPEVPFSHTSLRETVKLFCPRFSSRYFLSAKQSMDSNTLFSTRTMCTKNGKTEEVTESLLCLVVLLLNIGMWTVQDVQSLDIGVRPGISLESRGRKEDGWVKYLFCSLRGRHRPSCPVSFLSLHGRHPNLLLDPLVATYIQQTIRS